MRVTWAQVVGAARGMRSVLLELGLERFTLRTVPRQLQRQRVDPWAHDRNGRQRLTPSAVEAVERAL
ncbi:MAG TPA: hypothetical protein VE782_01150 [Myxococcaceae bacterium]|nr:hypothetical protein [Myxococcaceae bacterium]